MTEAEEQRVQQIAAVRKYFALNGTRVELDEMRQLTSQEITELYEGIPHNERRTASW